MKRLAVTLALISSQSAYPCTPTNLSIQTRVEPSGSEYQQVALETTGGTKRGVRIDDHNGFVSLVLMASATKDLDDDKISALKNRFLASLDKGIAYYKKSAIQHRQRGNEGPPRSNRSQGAREMRIDRANKIAAELGALADQVSSQGLTKQSFGTFMNRIYKAHGESTDFTFQLYEGGTYVAQAGQETLTKILGDDVYKSVISMSDQGVYSASASSCVSKSVLAEATANSSSDNTASRK